MKTQIQQSSMSQMMQYPMEQNQVFYPSQQCQQSNISQFSDSMNTWSVDCDNKHACSHTNSFRGRRASGEVQTSQNDLSVTQKEFTPMKLSSNSFVPQDKPCGFQIKEIDQKSNGSVTTQSQSDHENCDHFEEGALDENSDAMKEYNNYCEATRKKQKKVFVNAEERQEFNEKVEMKRKTEMCKNIIHFGECKFGSNCSYAHNKDELLKKKHVQSNYMTKLCTQFHDHDCGVCNYGERCQFLHSIYDRRRPIGFMQGLYEGARLTMLRAEQISDSQGADFVWVNLVKGDGCGAPKSRLPVFQSIYNKEEWSKQQQEDQQNRQNKKQVNFVKYNSIRKCGSYQQGETASYYPKRQCNNNNRQQAFENQRSNNYYGQPVF